MYKVKYDAGIVSPGSVLKTFDKEVWLYFFGEGGGFLGVPNSLGDYFFGYHDKPCLSRVSQGPRAL